VFNPTWIYAAAVYAFGVALLRRAGAELPRRVAIFFYGLVFIAFYLPLTQDYVNLPVDFLRALPPWSYTTSNPTVANGQLNDLVLQITPWAHQVREGWRSLSPPLWNHFSASGYPLLASAQSSALSPLRILGLPLSLAHAMTFEATMKVLIALTFMFLWCRRRGYSELASVTGAVAFGLSSFIFVWLHFPLVTTACLVPAIFYLIDLLVERPTIGRFTAAAAVWAIMLFGGHPETVSHTFFIAALYVAWIVGIERGGGTSWKERRRFLGVLAGTIVVSGLLAAPLLIPFAEAVTKSKRYLELAASPHTARNVPFSDFPSTVVLLQPHFYGEFPFESWGPAHAESISGFAGYLGVAAWFALIAHVVRRRAWRSREMFFVLATLFVLGVILAWPGISDLFHLFFQLAANARLRLMFVLLLAVQTAAAVDLARRDPRSLLIGIAAASALLLMIFASHDFAHAYHRDAAVLALLPSVLVLLVATVCAMTGSRDTDAGEVIGRRHYFAVLILLVAIVGELREATRHWNPIVSSEWMYPKTPILQRLEELKAEIPANEPFRIVGSGPAFFPNISAVYGFEDVRAHDPMANGRYINMLALNTAYDPTDYFAKWAEWDKRLIDFLNVRYVITTWGGELPPRYVLLYDGHDGRIYENPDVLPRFYAVRNVVIEYRKDHFRRRLADINDQWAHTALLELLKPDNQQMNDDLFNPRPTDSPLATARIVSARPTDYTLDVAAPRYSLVVSSIPWWPGWKIEQNGTRLHPIRVNGAFLGFAVPPGRAEVRVWYAPWSFQTGVAIALVTIAGLVIARFYLRRRRARTSGNVAEPAA
jgi:hypothetical protein